VTTRPALRLRREVHVLWIAPLATAGALVAMLPQTAAADGLLPLPTITVPSVPTVTLPPVLPTTTVATTTSAAPGPAPTTATSTSESTHQTSSAPAVAGAQRLSNGAISIPVTSVRAPAELRLVVSIAPRTLQRARQPLTAIVQVADSRGYVVRGVRVTLRSVPAGRLASVARSSGANGRVVLATRHSQKTLKRGVLSLLVAAADPASPKAASVSVSIRIPIRPVRR